MTSLGIILKSKFNKKKRQKHIAQMERNLGLTTSEPVAYEYKNHINPTKYKLHAEHKINLMGWDLDGYEPYEVKTHYKPRNVTEMRRFFDGAQFEDGMEGIDLDTVKQYRKINECFNPEFRVELSEMRGVPYAVIRTIDGGISTHIYLTMNYATVVIYGNRHEFSDVKNKLENMGYVVKYGPENCYDFRFEPF